jgi:hypothetical protein
VLDGLVRVDIFETSNNDDNGDPVWAVNEMESFEAIFEGSNAARRAQTHSKITKKRRGAEARDGKARKKFKN